MKKKKKRIKNSRSIIILGDLLRLLRYIKVPLTTRQQLRVFVPGRKECLYLPAHEAYEHGDFRLREDAKSWYLLCEIDQSSGVINVNIFIFFFIFL